MERSLVSQLNRRLVLVLLCVSALSSCRIAAEPAIRTITAETLADKYSVSVEAARREFDGNDLFVEGSVLNPVAMPKNDGEEGRVLLGSENLTRGVECWFTRYESAEFVGIKPGDFVVVKGTFNGGSGPALKFCKLVKKLEVQSD